jgi:lactate permease
VQFAIARSGAASMRADSPRGRSAWGGWVPWIVVSVIVIVWVHAGIAMIGDTKIKWPGLHNAVYVSLYHKSYAAIWDFQPLGTGTAILLAAIVTISEVNDDRTSVS